MDFYNILIKNGEKEEEYEREQKEIILYVCYSSLLVIYQPIFFILIWRSISKIKEEIKMKVLDVFKVGQYTFLICFLIARQLFFLFQFLQQFTYFYVSGSFVILFFIITFEWINTAWWFLFIIQLWKYRKLRDDDYQIEESKTTEKAVFILFLLHTFLLFIVVTGILIASISLDCFDWDAYNDYTNWNKYWKILHEKWGQVLSQFFSIAGIAQSLLRLVLALILLKLLKKYVYSYYIERRWRIIFVTLGTIFIFCFKYIYNIILTDANITDLTAIFNLRKSEKVIKLDTSLLIASFLIALFNLIFEVVLLKANIDNVDYKTDLIVLRNSWGLIDSDQKASIFLIKGLGITEERHLYVSSRVRPSNIENSENTELLQKHTDPTSIISSSDSSQETNREKYKEGFMYLVKLNSEAERKKSSEG